MNSDARLHLDSVLRRGLFPPMETELKCFCDYNSGPEPDCPEHGSIQFWIHQNREVETQNYLLAMAIKEIKGLAEAFTEEGHPVEGLRILQALSRHLDLTPERVWPQSSDFNAPIADKDVPF